MAPDLNIVVIGVGNDYRSDDGVGPVVARSIAGWGLPGIRFVDQIGDGTDLIYAWHDTEAAFVIDCIRSGAKAGTIMRFEVGRDDIPEEIPRGLSAHAFSITDTIRLARTIGKLPARLIVYGIEGAVFSFGSRLTPSVAASAAEVADSILNEIVNMRHNSIVGKPEK